MLIGLTKGDPWPKPWINLFFVFAGPEVRLYAGACHIPIVKEPISRGKRPEGAVPFSRALGVLQALRHCVLRRL